MRLNYKTFGAGTPVIVLHGLLGSLDNWQSFARKLSSDFRVFTVDLRNHGKSPHSAEHTYDAMSKDLLDFFEEHKIEKAHVIGHSMGGKVAMQFAISHPEKILKLFIVDIAPRSYESGHDLIFEALLSIDISKVARREEADALLARKIPDSAVRQFLLKNLDRQADGSFSWKMNLQGLWKNYSNINVPIQSALPVEIQTFVIKGGKSNYVKDADLKSFQQIFPSTKLITIENAGHWVHAEAPDEFYKTVRQELQSAA